MRLLFSLLLIMFLFTGCATMREQYEQGRTRAYDNRTKEERQQAKEDWAEWQRQYDEFKKRRYKDE